MSRDRATERDSVMMDKAIGEARWAIQHGKVGVGALLAWGGEILALDHNRAVETGDLTAHGEMVVLRGAAFRLQAMTEDEKAEVTLYTTLAPCLMCSAALSFVGVRRVVYSALAEDTNEEHIVARGITLENINPLLTRGPLTLVPGVKREEGRELLALMGAAAH